MEDNKNVLEAIIQLSEFVFRGNLNDRRNIAAKIFALGSRIALSEIKILLMQHSTEMRVSGFIAAKSYSINNNIDIGYDNDIQRVVGAGISDQSSFIRFRTIDFIGSSEALFNQYKDELLRQFDIEENRAVQKIIKVTISKFPESVPVAESSEKLNQIIIPDYEDVVRKFVQESETEKAIDKLLDVCADYERIECDLVAVINSEYTRLKKDNILGIIEYDDFNRHINVIHYRILQLL